VGASHCGLRPLLKTQLITPATAAPAAATASTATAAPAPASAAGTSAPTAASAISATAPTATATTPAAFARRTGLVDNYVAAEEVLAVERLDSLSGFVIVVDFHEAEAAGLSGKAVAHQGHIGRSHACLGKPVADILFGSLKRQIAHIQFFHVQTPSFRGEKNPRACG
jgi:hypothetical protein